MSIRFSRTIAMLLAAGVAACGEAGEAQTDSHVRQMADELIPVVERAVGLTFKSAPAIAVRTRDQVYAYVSNQLDAEFPEGEFDNIATAYQLLRLIPDTLDLRSLLTDLLTEQVAGYYDPDSTMLYVVDGTDPAILRFTVAHELVHALQDQYMPLAPILTMKRQNDRRMAAQAVLEGQATFASLIVMLPGQDLTQLGGLWDRARAGIRQQQAAMPVLAAAPRFIREGLIFPYLSGADFMRWFSRAYPDTVPFGSLLPRSTEQILHPGRYQAGDEPVSLVLEANGIGDALYQDGLGEFETRLLLTELTGNESIGEAGAIGWGGDRYALYAAQSEHALVWYSVWDTAAAAEQFATLLDTEWEPRAGRRSTIERIDVSGAAGVRLVDAPEGWRGWSDLPAVLIAPND